MQVYIQKAMKQVIDVTNKSEPKLKPSKDSLFTLYETEIPFN